MKVRLQMKSTGVVRKIDHLGRIVIPKEIRKSMKIKDGESLEIYVEEDTILLKKTSTFNGLQVLASNFVEVLTPLLKKNIIITDMNEVIACNKEVSKQFLNQELSSDYLNILSKRDVYVAASPASMPITLNQTVQAYYLLIPVVVQGDLLGSILLFSEENEIEEADKTVLKFVLKFFEKNLEE